MFNDLMKEVNTNKKQQIAGKNVNVNAQSTYNNKNVQKKEADEIEDMLANLWSVRSMHIYLYQS